MPFATTISVQMKAESTVSDVERNGSSSTVTVSLLDTLFSELTLFALSGASDG